MNQNNRKGLGVEYFTEFDNAKKESSVFDHGFDETFQGDDRDFSNSIFFDSKHSKKNIDQPLFQAVLALDSSIKIAAEEVPKAILYDDRGDIELHNVETDVARASARLLNRCILDLETVNQYPLVTCIDDVYDKSAVTYRHFHVHEKSRHLVEMQSPLSWVCDLHWGAGLMLCSHSTTVDETIPEDQKKIDVTGVLTALYNSCPDIPGNFNIKGKLEYAIQHLKGGHTETKNLHAKAWEFPSASSVHTHSWKTVDPADGCTYQLFIGVLNMDIYRPWLNPRTVKVVQQAIWLCGKDLLSHQSAHHSTKKSDYEQNKIPNFIGIELIIETKDRRHVFSVSPFAGHENCTVSHIGFRQSIPPRGSQDPPFLGILVTPNNTDEIDLSRIQISLKKTESYVYVGAYKGKPMDNANIYAIHAVACAQYWGDTNYDDRPNLIALDRYPDLLCKVTRIHVAPWDIIVSSYIEPHSRNVVDTLISIVHYPPFGTQFTTKKRVIATRADGGVIQIPRSIRSPTVAPPRPPRKGPFFIRGLANTTANNKRLVYFHSDGSQEAESYLDKVESTIKSTMSNISLMYSGHWPENTGFFDYLQMNQDAWLIWKDVIGKVVTEYFRNTWVNRGYANFPTSFWYFSDDVLTDYAVFAEIDDQRYIQAYLQFTDPQDLPGKPAASRDDRLTRTRKFEEVPITNNPRGSRNKTKKNRKSSNAPVHTVPAGNHHEVQQPPVHIPDDQQASVHIPDDQQAPDHPVPVTDTTHRVTRARNDRSNDDDEIQPGSPPPPHQHAPRLVNPDADVDLPWRNIPGLPDRGEEDVYFNMHDYLLHQNDHRPAEPYNDFAFPALPPRHTGTVNPHPGRPNPSRSWRGQIPDEIRNAPPPRPPGASPQQGTPQSRASGRAQSSRPQQGTPQSRHPERAQPSRPQRAAPPPRPQSDALPHRHQSAITPSSTRPYQRNMVRDERYTQGGDIDKLLKKAEEVIKNQKDRVKNLKPRVREPTPIVVHPANREPTAVVVHPTNRPAAATRTEEYEAPPGERVQAPRAPGRRAQRAIRRRQEEGFHSDDDEEPWLGPGTGKNVFDSQEENVHLSNSIEQKQSSPYEKLSFNANGGSKIDRNLERRLNMLESKLRLMQQSENNNHLMKLIDQ